MSVHTYDSESMVISVLGSDPHGLGDGTFLEVERDDALFETIIGADGEVARAKIPGFLSTGRLTLLATSSFNLIMSAAMELDLGSGAGVGPLVVSEGNTRLAGGEAWIKTWPGVSYEKGAVGERVWEFQIAKLSVRLIGGNAP